ncbi:DMT family transporter [Aeribacillus composti]|uniref:DMT family transporter n=1 Tax=Aeribacillus composti TaxID=1868734 RepID=UPI00406AA263
MDKKLAYLNVVLASCLWGIIGIFVSNLYELGLSSIQIVSIRVLSTALILILYVVFRNQKSLKINLSHSWYFVGTGIVSFSLFNWCLFNTIQMTSVSIATILLYTAPAFVTIISRVVFKELLTTKKFLSLLLTFIGCSLVIGIFQNSNTAISFNGLIMGLGSGFFYALYSIFGKIALVKYDSLTVTLYTFIFASIVVTPLSELWEIAHLFKHVEIWLNIIGIGFLSTVIAFTLYTKALNTIEASRASIIATIEPVVASIVGFIVFQEELNFWQYIGIIMVITAIILVRDSKIDV